jgi:AAA-like domain/TIR domain
MIALKSMVNLFISYAHEDEAYRQEIASLLKGLRLPNLTVWDDRRFKAGDQFNEVILKQLKVADIILLLISHDFLASDYCYEQEMPIALRRQTQGEAIVVPIILRDCVWQDLPFSNLYAIPSDGKTDGKPIADFPNPDQAYRQIGEAVKKAIRELKPASQIAEPLPISTWEEPEGLVPIDSPFYIERLPIERDCYDEVIKPYSLIRIKAPAKMGKTSLLVRILHYAESEGYETIRLNLRTIKSQVGNDLDKFLQRLCSSVSARLNLPDSVTEYWKESLGGVLSCKEYFEAYLLKSLNKPMVLGLGASQFCGEYKYSSA